MKFKSLLILFCLAVYSECKWQRLKKHVIKDKIGQLENQVRLTVPTYAANIQENVNLILDATLVTEGGEPRVNCSLALDSTLSKVWAVGAECENTFCMHKNNITANTNDTGSAKQDQVQGKYAKDYYFSFLDEISNSLIDLGKLSEIIAADYVDPLYSKNLESSVDGVLGIGPSSPFVKQLKPWSLLVLYLGSREEPSLYLNFNKNISKLFILPNAAQQPLYIKTESQNFWKIPLDFIGSYIDANTWCGTGCSAVIDTTYTGISGPAKEINKLNEYLGADEDGNIDCYKRDLIMPLIFHIRGTSYKLHPKNFIVKADDRFDRLNSCKTVFEANYNYKRMWRLGHAFLQEYLTFFDYGEHNIAFVPLTENINIDFSAD